jgi:antitoxin component of RelBE/YafQ-DinJ toxin-antitoxin module
MKKDKLVQIRITENTKNKIEKLAKSLGYKFVTTLEYLLSGKIELDKLK